MVFVDHQIQCHLHLADLKRHKQLSHGDGDGDGDGGGSRSSKSSYRFPTHKLFRVLSSSPHYTCEVCVCVCVCAYVCMRVFIRRRVVV